MVLCKVCRDLTLLISLFFLCFILAFKETYRDFKIWQLFRRNFKGVISPAKPRITCVEDGFITTSNPCVICRDRYLVVDYRVSNVQ